MNSDDGYYSRPEEVLKALRDLFLANKERLGFAYVATQDENLLTEYPALDISAGELQREIHGTQKYDVIFEMSLWIYHANFEETHAVRAIEDMKLTTNVVEFLHNPTNRVLNDGQQNRIIFGFVSNELPGTVTTARGEIAATRLVWHGESLVNYNDS